MAAIRKSLMPLIILAVISGCSALLFLIRKDLQNLKFIQIRQQEEHQKTNQFLLSTIDWSTKRQKLILYLRDKIIEERQRSKRLSSINYEDAYAIAESDVIEAEKYPFLDPIQLLAMQKCESFFDKRAVSPTGALGVNQLMPSTGRLLCSSFGIQYSDSLLFDIRSSTKFAARLFDILFTTYGRMDLVLADYNGGPYAALYYKTKNPTLPQETQEYVPCVMKMFDTYKQTFTLYKADSMLLKTDSLLNIKPIKMKREVTYEEVRRW